MNTTFSSTIALAEVLAGFQHLLARCSTDSDRKVVIMTAHSYGALNDDEAGLLITSMMLEAT